jgi:uncharacterized membrane protein
MTTTDTVLLYILTIILSIFFLLGIVVLIALLKLIASIKRAVARAEDVIDSVESAAEVLRDTEGRLAVFKLVRNIVKMTKKARRNRN